MTERVYSGPPEYFPSVEFFAGLSICSQVRLRTDLQYSRQSFQNRTKIRTPDGWTWLTIPVKGGQHGNSLADTQIDDSAAWRRKHLQALRFNYQSSPYFDYVEPDLEEYYKSCGGTIGDAAAASAILLADLLGVDFDVTVASAPDEIEAGTSNAQYVTLRDRVGSSPEGAWIATPAVSAYRQNFEGFYPAMSALDILCNYGPEAWSMLAHSKEGNE